MVISRVRFPRDFDFIKQGFDMKYLFIADIHGNQFALKAVLEKALELEVDQIYCLGDMTGYFMGSNEVISLLKKASAICLKGNHDAFITNDLEINHEKKYFPTYQKTVEQLLPPNRKFLESLHSSAIINIDGKLAKLFHGGPQDELSEYVFPDKIEISNFESINADFFLFGHTHLQFVIKINEIFFANPGSVGLPRNGDFRAHFLLFNSQSQEFKSFQIPYELSDALKEFNKDPINRKLLHNLHFGRSSKKVIKVNNYVFLNENIIINLECNGMSIINTKFGAVLSQKSDRFLGELLYLVAYEDNELELTSTTLIFNWELKNYKLDDEILDIHFNRDNAGIYYKETFSYREFFKLDISDILNNAFATIEIFKNNNVKI